VSSPKYDVVIKAKATSTKIIDISHEIVRFESSDKGQSPENTILEFIGIQ
jgi:hypothetical protein